MRTTVAEEMAKKVVSAVARLQNETARDSGVLLVTHSELEKIVRNVVRRWPSATLQPKRTVRGGTAQQSMESVR